MKLIAVVTITRDNQEEVIKVFEELKKQDYSNWIFIVVDDYSKSIEKLQKINDPKFVLVKYPGSYEFSYGNKFNHAYRVAIKYNPEYIYKIHTDMYLTSDKLLSSMASVLKKNKDVAVVGPKIFNAENVNTWGPGIVKHRCGQELTITESYMIRTEYLTKYNGFQDEVFTWFMEEADFYLRIYKNGFQTKQVHESLIHYGGATSSHFSVVKKYHRTRSTLLFLYKHNKKYSFYKNLRWYLWEIKTDFKEGLSFLKEGKLKNFFLNFYFMAKGFFSALLVILMGKVNRI